MNLHWLTDEELVEAEQRARVFSGAWTGTSGRLALFTVHLVRMVRTLQEQGMTVMKIAETPAEKMLVEALDVVRNRRETYGPPREHFARTVQMLNGLLADKLKEPLTEADWAQIMIIDKLARHRGPAKSADTPIDLAGYASCLAECEA